MSDLDVDFGYARAERHPAFIEYHSQDHGMYWCTPAALDNAIATFLPASANGLRALVSEIMPEIDWSDLSVSEALVVLASFHGA